MSKIKSDLCFIFVIKLLAQSNIFTFVRKIVIISELACLKKNCGKRFLAISVDQDSGMFSQKKLNGLITCGSHFISIYISREFQELSENKYF